MRKWWVFSIPVVPLLAACPDFGGLSGGTDSGAGAATIDASGGTCTSSQKMCVGRCVEQNDPSVGCSGACSACGSFANAQPACALQNNAEVCSTGACNAQYGDCDNDSTNGCETQTTTTTHCGACGTSCAPLPYCEPSSGASSGYVCSSSCDAPNSICGSGAGAQCVDTDSDNANCGGCGLRCAVTNGVGTCGSGKCGITCNPKYFSCGGACLAPNDSQCGASCQPCGAGTNCETNVSSPSYGTCVSSSAGAKCDAGTDFSEDPNCGACGVDCATNGLKCCPGNFFLDGGRAPNTCKSKMTSSCAGQ